MKKKILVAILLGCIMVSMVGCGHINNEKVESGQSHQGVDEDSSAEISIDMLKRTDATSANEFKYYLNENGTYTISEYYGNETVVVIPDEIEGIAVTDIASGVFSGSEILEAIKIGNNVKALESKAFINCSNLKYVILGDKVKEIGEYCFSGSAVKDIELNDGLEKLEYCSLYAKTLKTITIPSSVIEIDAAFATSTVVHVKSGSYAETYMIEEIKKYPNAGYEYVVD